MQTPKSIDELIFEENDLQIFNIPDTKTKLLTLQNYFFPRLEILTNYSLDLISKIYDVNPHEKMTFVYRPSPRREARSNIDFGTVHFGIAAKRTMTKLKIFRNDGKAFCHHPTYLIFKVLPIGTIHAELIPFRQSVDDDYVKRISILVKNNSIELMPLLSLAHITHKTYYRDHQILPFCQAIIPDEVGFNALRLTSPKYYFPVDIHRGLNELVVAFALLYALAESFICIGEGEEPLLRKRLQQFKQWYLQHGDEYLDWENIDCVPEIPELSLETLENSVLNSYSFIRPGKWWTVLSRDKWKCLSCGRSAREDGVILEVDHILPRSKGGSDELENLQTLCKKCNIGKSNRDSTRL